MDDEREGITITLGATTVCLSLVYPDQSRVQLTMPRPPGMDAQTGEQAELLVRRMARRLLMVAAEDLGNVG